MPSHDEHHAPDHEADAPTPAGQGAGASGTRDGGVDVLMAVLLDEPLSAQGREDPAVVAAHRAAAADVAVLRERLGLIGDALAAPAEPGVPAGRDEAGGEVRERVAPGAAVRGGRRAGPGAGSRGPRRGRPARVAFGVLVAAVAATVVAGMGWLVAQPGGVSGASDSGTAAQADSKEAAGVTFGSPRYLACARLVAEGTVLAVERMAGAERVTLSAGRYYKGEGEIVFLRDPAAGAPLHEGDLVMVGMPAGGQYPDAVIVGEADIARERPRIIAALPEARTLTCG